MLSRLKTNFENLDAEKRKKVVLGFYAGIALLALVGIYYVSPFSKKDEAPKSLGPTKAALSIDKSMLEKSTVAKMDHQEKELEELKKAVKAAENGREAESGLKPNGNQQGLKGQSQLGSQGQKQNQGLRNSQGNRQMPVEPLPPPPQSRGSNVNGGGGSNKGELMQLPAPPAPLPPKEEVIGSIGRAANDAPVNQSTGDDSKKKAKQSVYLPPSFMVAHLLTGLNAPVTQGGKSNPVPVLIRVAAPAQLPNEVKMNLKSCFVVAEAVGDLAQERALVRLVNLSCLSKNGQAVIDQSITGFLQDSDSKAGLSGRVVAKFGSKIARSFLAGLASGIGSGLAQSTSNVSTTALGLVSTPSTSFRDIGLQGAGKGIEKAGNEIEKFYLDLAHMSMPVIECGSGKKVTLVITKGANLEIKSFPSVSWY